MSLILKGLQWLIGFSCERNRPGGTGYSDDFANARWVEEETRNVLTGTFVTRIATPVIASGCGDFIEKVHRVRIRTSPF